MESNNRKCELTKSGIQILIWLSIVVFFVYSFQSTMDFESISNSGRHRALIRILTALSQPNFSNSEITSQVITKMWETLKIAFLATTISAVLAIPFAFLTSRNSSILGSVLNFILQPIFAVIRAIHPIIITSITIILVGIGPTAGVLALTLFSTVVLIGKFTEYIKEHEPLKWSSLIKIYFPVVAFRYFPTNALTASILGFVGGGGIGFLFQQSTYLLNYQDASVALFAMIISISSLDLLSQAVWNKIHKAPKEA